VTLVLTAIFLATIAIVVGGYVFINRRTLADAEIARTRLEKVAGSYADISTGAAYLAKYPAGEQAPQVAARAEPFMSRPQRLMEQPEHFPQPAVRERTAVLMVAEAVAVASRLRTREEPFRSTARISR